MAYDSEWWGSQVEVRHLGCGCRVAAPQEPMLWDMGTPVGVRASGRALPLGGRSRGAGGWG